MIDDRDLATADRDHQRPLVTNRYATAAGRPADVHLLVTRWRTDALVALVAQLASVE